MNRTRNAATHSADRDEGYILVPVIVMLTLVLAAVYTTTLQGSVGMESTSRARESRQAMLVARSGIEHAIYAANGSNCANYALPLTPFGPHEYSASYSPNSSSPVSITATAVLASGRTHSITRESARIYESSGAQLFLQPSTSGKDTSLRRSGSSNNLGARTLIEVDEPGETHGLFEFDISGLPPNAVVRGATLELFVDSGFMSKVSAYRVTRSWAEGTCSGSGSCASDGATWETFDGLGSWTAEGGDFEPAAAASADVVTSGAWVAFDLSALVSAWHASVPNHGVLLQASNNWIEFVSSDHPNANHHPKLTIDYDCECDPNASGGLVTIQPGPGTGKDAKIVTPILSPDKNYGSDDKLALNAFPTMRSLIEFDLSDLPANAIVSDAQLELYFDSADAFTNGQINVHRVTSPWTEGTGGSGGLSPADGANWNTSDGLTPWMQSGGDFDSTAIDTVTVTLPSPRWQKWNVTPAVSDWKQGVQPNYGLLVKILNGSITNPDILSSDHANQNLRPKLTVSYYCPCGADCSLPNAVGRNLLMIVVDLGSLTSQESTKKALIESWGFTVSLIDEDATETEYQTALAANDVVFISEDVTASRIGEKLSAAPIGVVSEEANLPDELGLAQSVTWVSGTQVDIQPVAHPITTPFAPGALTILSTSQSLAFLSGGLSSDLAVLGDMPAGGEPILATLEQGEERWDGHASLDSRRVFLPWGGNSFDIAELNEDGRTIFKRAIEWAATTPSAPAGYLDRFAAPTCDPAIDAVGSFGSFDWSASSWTESEGDGFCNGNIRVEQEDFSYRMRMTGTVDATRNVDLAGFAFGTLRFRYKTVGTFDATHFVAIETSDNAGATWTEIGRIDSPNAASDTTIDLAITTALTTTSAIRFRAENLGAAEIWLDDVAVVDEETIPPFVCTIRYLDSVTGNVYSGDDGSLSWSTDWLEVNESDGPDSGDERAMGSGSGFALRVGDNDGGGEGLEREADLSMTTTATLNFVYQRVAFDDANDFVAVGASSDGGANWTDLGTIGGPGSDAEFVAASYSLDAYLASDTRIRFVTSSNLGATDLLWIDDVEICLETNPVAGP